MFNNKKISAKIHKKSVTPFSRLFKFIKNSFRAVTSTLLGVKSALPLTPI